jgi:hypothetical protein
MTTRTGYRIFDSVDNPCSPIADRPDQLYDILDRLEAEAEQEASTITYAIGLIRPDGYVTFDI